MMIHELPEQVRGNSHVRLTAIREAPGSGIVVSFILGTMDGERFVPDSLIPEVRRYVNQPGAEKVRGRAAEAGAPVTAGAREWRRSDLLAHLDAVGWVP